MSCKCAERLNREEKPYEETAYSRYHDCDYVKARNALIPQATERAKRQLMQRGVTEENPEYGPLWTEAFAGEMQWLARGLLLR